MYNIENGFLHPFDVFAWKRNTFYLKKRIKEVCYVW